MTVDSGRASPSTGALVEAACILEARAPKPGNVSPGHPFDDLGFEDLVRSARAVRAVFDRAAERPVGETVLDAVRASRAVHPGNANLGIVLLLAPLAAVPRDDDARRGVRRVLEGLGPGDARAVWEAIRTARPGGLGTASEADIGGPPPGDIVDAMRLAEDRDRIARQWSRGYEDVFDHALPALSRALAEEADVETATVRLHLELLARFPDSHIARRCGKDAARDASRRAAAALAAGAPGAAGPAERLRALDAWLRAGRPRRNPGTTADFVAAALFLALRGGILSYSLPGSPQARPGPGRGRAPAQGPTASEGGPSPAGGPLAAAFGPRMDTYRVRVTKDYLAFCSAHFIVFEGTQCERLHGHNYRVAATVEAALDEDGLVLDFITLKRILRGIANELDHRLLVPLESRKFTVETGERSVRIAYADREWIVPRGDCALLPVENTTAELLARHLLGRLLEELQGQERQRALRWVEVEVEESPGQSATYRRDLEGTRGDTP